MRNSSNFVKQNCWYVSTSLWDPKWERTPWRQLEIFRDKFNKNVAEEVKSQWCPFPHHLQLSPCSSHPQKVLGFYWIGCGARENQLIDSSRGWEESPTACVRRRQHAVRVRVSLLSLCHHLSIDLLKKLLQCVWFLCVRNNSGKKNAHIPWLQGLHVRGLDTENKRLFRYVTLHDLNVWMYSMTHVWDS